MEVWVISLRMPVQEHVKRLVRIQGQLVGPLTSGGNA